MAPLSSENLANAIEHGQIKVGMLLSRQSFPLGDSQRLTEVREGLPGHPETDFGLRTHVKKRLGPARKRDAYAPPQEQLPPAPILGRTASARGPAQA